MSQFTRLNSFEKLPKASTWQYSASGYNTLHCAASSTSNITGEGVLKDTVV